jgi:hypothetical protein
MQRRSGFLSSVAVLLAAAGCGEGDPDTLALGRGSQAFINGEDDRREYFELTEDAERSALERFTTVLMTQSAAEALVAGDMEALPTWGEVDRLCPDEPFVAQPAAAFCSGVLLDWDVVLTSGHCIDAVPLSELRIVFNYFYRSPDEFALSEGDVYEVRRVLASRRDPDAEGERLDFAWLELQQEVRPPHEPARAYTLGRGAELDEPVISVGAGGGVPLKLDGGGRVQDVRAEFDDYLIADTDTSGGSSGGALFDSSYAVVGSLARGALDFALTDAGCYVTNVETDPSAAQEQFTYVHRAVEVLCDAHPNQPLCQRDCEQPCTAVGARVLRDHDSCALGPAAPRKRGPLLLVIALAAGLIARRIRARGPRMEPIRRE